MSLQDLITLRAFHAHSKNVKLPLHARIPGEHVLVLGIGAQQIRAAMITVPRTGGDLAVPQHSQIFQKRAAVADLIGPIKKRPEYAKAKYALVVLQQGWKVYLRNGYFERSEINVNLRRDSLSVIDETTPVGDVDVDAYHHADTYGALLHPSADRLLLFSAQTSEISHLHDNVQDAGLSVIGCKIGAFAALEYFYSNPKQAEEAEEQGDVLYFDRHCYCLIENDRAAPDVPPNWVDARYFSKRPEEVMENMAQAIRERTNPERPLTLLAGKARVEELSRVFPKIQIKSGVESENFDVFSACTR